MLIKTVISISSTNQITAISFSCLLCKEIMATTEIGFLSQEFHELLDKFNKDHTH